MRFALMVAFTMATSGALVCQPRPYLRATLHAATDSEAFWFGPAVGGGTGLIWPSRFGLLAEYQYFGARKNSFDSYYGQEKGEWNQHTAGLYATWQGSKTGKGFYAMAGVAWQWRNAFINRDIDPIEQDFSFPTAALELGYRVTKLSTGGLAFSIKATGPTSYRDETWYVTEILTQLSAGLVADIGFGKNNRKKTSRNNTHALSVPR